MTPPKKVVHHGRVKMTVIQAMALVEGLRGLNAPADGEVEIKMGFEHLMEARVSTGDGTALGKMECGPVESVRVTPLSPAA